MASGGSSEQDGAVAWEHVRSSYDAVAGKYETRFLDELRAKPRDRELLERFAAAVNDPVVEIGCGPGQIGAFVGARGRSVFGLDLSTRMAALAHGRLDAALVADMRALPFPAARLGGLVAFYSVIHVRRAELGAVLAEFHRVLRPGGRVLFSAHAGDHEVELDELIGEPVHIGATFFELDELLAATESAGFEVALAERRSPYASEATVRVYVEAVKPDQPESGDPD